LTLRILDTEFGNSWKPMVYQVKLEIVGSVGVRFENHRANVTAMVLSGASEVFVAVPSPLHELDVVILPSEQRLVVNPASPDIAKKSLK